LFIITKPGSAEQTITKSRFFATAFACENEREVGLGLRKIMSLHTNAHHLAYAFRLKMPSGVVQRFSDAGEPSGTAGMPILKLIEGRDLINVCVGVIRYYGGINLGTGGLARAYGGTAKMALDASQISDYIEMQEIVLKVTYQQMDMLTNLLIKCNGTILEKTFNTDIDLVIRLPKTEVQMIVGRLSKYG
jgi:uncharacterized YigZ family protein